MDPHGLAIPRSLRRRSHVSATNSLRRAAAMDYFKALLYKCDLTLPMGISSSAPAVRPHA